MILNFLANTADQTPKGAGLLVYTACNCFCMFLEASIYMYLVDKLSDNSSLKVFHMSLTMRKRVFGFPIRSDRNLAV